MNRRFNLLILLICIPFSLQAQWIIIDGQFAGDRYLGVANRDTLVYSDSYTGTIYHSFDGGTSWSPFQTILTDSWIFAFDFPTDQIGYGVGGTIWGDYRGVVIKTTDGGATWDTLTTNSGGTPLLQYVEFLNPDTGFVADASNMFKTTDGGQSFVPAPVVPDEDYFAYKDIASSSDGVVYTANKRAVFSPVIAQIIYIYRSEDVGESWTKVYTDTVYEPFPWDGNIRFVFQIEFPTPDTGFASGGEGLFLKTTDGGHTWARTFLSPFSKLDALCFTSAEVGYVNNNFGIYKTSDGGGSWVGQIDGSYNNVVRDIQFGDENTGYARSDKKLLKISIGGATFTTEPDPTAGIMLYPNPSSNEIFIDTPADLVIESIEIFDSRGRSVKTVNTGSTPASGVDVGSLKQGVYFIRIATQRGSTVYKVEIVR